MNTKDELYEKHLKMVAEDLGITNLTDIAGISITLTAEQLWSRARIIARGMNIAYHDGCLKGLREAQEVYTNSEEKVKT